MRWFRRKRVYPVGSVMLEKLSGTDKRQVYINGRLVGVVQEFASGPKPVFGAARSTFSVQYFDSLNDAVVFLQDVDEKLQEVAKQ